MRINTLIGCIPGIGTFVGIGRIAIALNKAQDRKVNQKAKSIFDTLNKREVFQGACEIVPILGPMLYGATRGWKAVAKKIDQAAQRRFEIRKKNGQLVEKQIHSLSKLKNGGLFKIEGGVIMGYGYSPFPQQVTLEGELMNVKKNKDGSYDFQIKDDKSIYGQPATRTIPENFFEEGGKIQVWE